MTLPDGRHLSFPFHVGSDGRTAQITTLEEHVRDELMQLILTNPGERAFLPEFGGGVRRLVFEAAGDVTEAMAKAMISQALSRWLSQRLTVEDLVVEARNETIVVDLKYRIAGTEDSRRVRFERKGG
jgi:phage baseplate assembly protein W